MPAKLITKRVKAVEPTAKPTAEPVAQPVVDIVVESDVEQHSEPTVEPDVETQSVPIKVETRGRKKKYNTDEDRINARKLQQKRYRDRQKEKVKELLALVEGLSPEDIVELKAKAQELRNKNRTDVNQD